MNDISDSSPVIYRFAGVRDADGINARPGAIAVRSGRVIAVGASGHVDDMIVKSCKNIEMRDFLAMPMMVNAHAHLDLTGVGPRPYGGHFPAWLQMVIDQAPADEKSITTAVEQGVRMSIDAGVGAIGDIARSPSSLQALLNAEPIEGVGCLECFGIGSGQQAGMKRLRDLLAQLPSAPATTGGKYVENQPRVRIGIQPHAPYSAGLDLYKLAVELSETHGYGLSTHLAESLAEIRFLRDAEGPLVELLKTLNKWDPTIKPTGSHPVDWLRSVLSRGSWLLAHCNFLEDRHLPMLGDTRASVVYCPIASDYFGHFQTIGPGDADAPGDADHLRPDPPRNIPDDHRRRPGHRYRELLDAGVNVCLGTDSIICQPPDSPQPLSILNQMRYLYQRDATDPDTLLRMATINGARALKLSPATATLATGAPNRVMTVKIDPSDPTDLLQQALARPDYLSTSLILS